MSRCKSNNSSGDGQALGILKAGEGWETHNEAKPEFMQNNLGKVY